MPEDQPYNGDVWNDQMSALLAKFGWEFVGDSNFDIENEDNKAQGIDRLLSFKNPHKNNFSNGCFLESKRYAVDSFSETALKDWIIKLDEKLSKNKNSPGLVDLFPIMANVSLSFGIIAIWCHELDNYEKFKGKFNKALSNIVLNPKLKLSPNKIYILDNEIILKLASLHFAIVDINGIGNKSDFNFFYPSSSINAASRSNVLTPNYIFSKFILGDFIGPDSIENKVVFYFGKLSINSFKRLRSSLGLNGYLDKDKPLQIYTYSRDDNNFRKIIPEIKKIFRDINLSLLEMELLNDLPTFMRNRKNG